jgi:hypothetical protein
VEFDLRLTNNTPKNNPAIHYNIEFMRSYVNNIILKFDQLKKKFTAFINKYPAA